MVSLKIILNVVSLFIEQIINPESKIHNKANYQIVRFENYQDILIYSQVVILSLMAATILFSMLYLVLEN